MKSNMVTVDVERLRDELQKVGETFGSAAVKIGRTSGYFKSLFRDHESKGELPHLPNASIILIENVLDIPRERFVYRKEKKQENKQTDSEKVNRFISDIADSFTTPEEIDCFMRVIRSLNVIFEKNIDGGENE